ncbi:dnaJ-related protein SCJ1 isoform X5 [Populus alba x Populus x berolinensis]|uniref:DnaJ-related protein SCJ1 isoform X5 n=1 Tax=Populus alba x Populus x berolinensis TaxID=444605 RepID=A0AAD6Q2Z9_9ROSI|nr:dnaJ-related protein SCJ1 isoform X5 [Populus alba x Populus x berolinensis]
MCTHTGGFAYTLIYAFLTLDLLLSKEAELVFCYTENYAETIDDAVAMFKGSTLITSACFILIFSSAVLSDPAKRFEYDLTGIYEIDKYTVREYLARFKGMILTCNGLGISNTSTWTQQLTETKDLAEK